LIARYRHAINKVNLTTTFDPHGYPIRRAPYQRSYFAYCLTRYTFIYEDCESAVALSKENRFRKRSKHIDVRWSFIVEKQRHGDLKVVSVSRTIMLADILCSPRAAATFSVFRNKILGYQTPPAASEDRVAPITDAHARIDDRSAKASSTAHKDSGDGSHK